MITRSIIFSLIFLSAECSKLLLENNKTTVIVRVILPNSPECPFRKKLVKPAINLAVNYLLKNEPVIKNNFKFVVQYGLTSCNISQANQMKWTSIGNIDSNQISFYLGPVCFKLFHWTRIFAYIFNMPIITPGVNIAGFHNSGNNVIRISPPYLETAYSLKQLLYRVNIRDGIALLFQNSSSNASWKKQCFHLAQAIEAIYKHNIILKDISGKNEDALKKDLEKLKKDREAIIICGSDDNVRKVLVAAKHTNMLRCTRYKWFAIDVNNKYKTGIWKSESSVDVETIRAYEKLIVLTLKDSNGTMSQLLLNKYKKLGIKNVDKVNEYIQNFQESVLLYGYALKKAFLLKQDFYNRSVLLKHMCNTTLKGFYRNITIDSYGDRIGDFDFSILTDKKDGKFETLGNKGLKICKVHHRINFLKVADSKSNSKLLVVVSCFGALLTCSLFIVLPICIRHWKELSKRNTENQMKNQEEKKDEKMNRRDENSSSTRMSYLEEETSTSSKDSYKNYRIQLW